MGSIKKILTFLTVVSHTLFGFSAAVKVVSCEDFAILKIEDSVCHEELEKKIKKLLNISELRLTDNVFKSDSHLYLTNQKEELFSHKNPMQGYIGAHKILLLHFKKDKLFISLVDHNNRPIKSEPINSCKNSIRVNR